MFRFTIRDVLWLTVIVALAVCWGLDRAQLRREKVARKEAEVALANAELARSVGAANYSWAGGIQWAKPAVAAKRQAAATSP